MKVEVVQFLPSVLDQAAGRLPRTVVVCDPTTTALLPAPQVARGTSIAS